MTRVDLFGPPGVGKSSLVARLREHRGLADWAIDADLRMACARRLAQAQSGSVRRAQLLFALRVPKLRDLYARSLFQDEHCRAIGASSQLTGDFVEWSIARVLRGSAKLDLRVKSAGDLLFAIGLAAIYEQCLGGEHILYDDGSLTHFGTRFAFVEDAVSFAADYCRLMPRPDAAIVLSDQADVIVNRIRQRERTQGKLIPLHRNKTDSELKGVAARCLAMCQAGADMLERHGTRVLKLNASDAVPDNARKVATFLREVLVRHPPTSASYDPTL